MRSIENANKILESRSSATCHRPCSEKPFRFKLDTWLAGAMLVLCTLISGSLRAESPNPGGQVLTGQEKLTALNERLDGLLSMSPALAKEQISDLDINTSLSLYDLLVRRSVAAGTSPQVFYLAEHIQSLKATEASQRRLESLLWVIILTLVLFSGYLTYVLIDQRRIYNKIKGQPGFVVQQERTEVYRGE